MKIDWISYLAQNHLPRLLQGDRTLEIYWSLAWLSWLDEKSWSYESRQVRYIFVLELVLEWNVRSGTLQLGKLAVQPQFLILGDCSVVLGTTEIPVLAGIWKGSSALPITLLIIPIMFSWALFWLCYTGHTGSQCFTGYRIPSTITHKCWFCAQFPKIRRKILLQLQMLSVSCHLAFCLADDDRSDEILLSSTT